MVNKIKKQLKKEQKINPGAVIDKPGNSVVAKKVSYRNYKPVTDFTKCIKCGKCWAFCPDMAFKKNEEGFFINIEAFCKGCGLCSRVCPVKCISRMEVTQ